LACFAACGRGPRGGHFFAVFSISLPADKAGLAPGVKVIGVNGKKFSQNRLRDAIADSVTRKKVELLIEEGEDFRTLVVPYADGLRYLDLERVSTRPDGPDCAAAGDAKRTPISKRRGGL
jgi:predicted metalloprotease with PDZ domain